MPLDTWREKNDCTMKQTEIKKKLQELGYDLTRVSKGFYMFSSNGTKMLYVPDSKATECLRFAIPCLYAVTDENKQFLTDIINETNLSVKYAKTLIINQQVWMIYEYHTSENEDIEEVITHCLLTLLASQKTFFDLIEGVVAELEEREGAQ